MATKTIKKPLMQEHSLDQQSFFEKYVTQKNLFIIAIVAGAVFTIYSFRGLFIAATVNGQVISRLSVIKALEAQGGKRILESIVTENLIKQEAKKKNILIDEKIVDKELATTEEQLKTQGQNLADWLAFQVMTKETFREQVRLQKIVEELLGKDIAVTDAEVADFTEKNKEVLSERVGSDSAKVATVVKEQLKRQKLNEKVQPWLAELQKNAKINYFVSY